MKVNGLSTLRTLENKARWARFMYLISLALACIAVLSGLMQIALIVRAATVEITEAEANANDVRQRIVGISRLVAILPTAIAFFIWIHGAYRNLVLLGVPDLTYSPAWAVGGFRVPVLNFFRPFQVMCEIWQKSDPATSLATADTPVEVQGAPKTLPALLVAWWVLTLISYVFGRIILQMFKGTENTLQSLKTQSMVLVVSDALTALTAVAAIVLVGRITRWQSGKWSVPGTT